MFFKKIKVRTETKLDEGKKAMIIGEEIKGRFRKEFIIIPEKAGVTEFRKVESEARILIKASLTRENKYSVSLVTGTAIWSAKEIRIRHRHLLAIPGAFPRDTLRLFRKIDRVISHQKLLRQKNEKHS